MRRFWFVILVLFALQLVSLTTYSQGSWLNLNVDHLTHPEMVAIPTDSVVYFIGGNRTFYKWNPSTNVYTQLASHPSVSQFSLLNGHYTFHKDGYVYVGVTGSASFYRYDTNTNTWISRATPGYSLPGGEIIHAQSDNSFYAFKYNTPGFQKYDIASNSWSYVSYSGPAFNSACHIIRGLPDGFECWTYDFQKRFRFQEPNLLTVQTFVGTSPYVMQNASQVVPWALLGDQLFVAPNLTGLGNFGDPVMFDVSSRETGAASWTLSKDLFVWNNTLYSIGSSDIRQYIPGCTTNITASIIAPDLAAEGGGMVLDFSVNIPGGNLTGWTFSLLANGQQVDSQPGASSQLNYFMPGEAVFLELNASNVWCDYTFTDSISFPATANGGWTSATIFPPESPPRGEAVAVALENGVLTGLGRVMRSGNIRLKDLYLFEYESKRVTRQPDFPGEARNLASYFGWDNKAFIIGGYGYSGSALNDGWMYDADVGEWTTLPPLPVGIADGVHFVIGDMAYVGLGTCNDFYALDLNQLTWSEVIDFPAATRMGAVAFAFDSMGYVGLGLQGSSALNTFYRFDPELLQFTFLGTPEGFPGGIANVCAMVQGGLVLLGYGRYLTNVVIDGLLFDPIAFKVYPGFDRGHLPRLRAAYCTHDDRCYMFFGEESNLFGTGIYTGSAGLSSVILMSDFTNPYASFGKVVTEWSPFHCTIDEDHQLPINASPMGIPVGVDISEELNWYLDSPQYQVSVYGQDYFSSYSGLPEIYLNETGEVDWMTIYNGSGCADTMRYYFEATCLPEVVESSSIPFNGSVRRFIQSAQVGSVAYLGLGYHTGSELSNHWWKFDLETDQWSALTQFPGTPRTSAATFVIGDKIYLATGYSGQSTHLNDLWEFNTLTGLWTPRASLPVTGLFGTYSFAYGGKGYVGGGKFSSTGYNYDLYEYNPENDTWVVQDIENNQTEFLYANAVVTGNGIELIGGSNTFSKNTWRLLPDSWTIEPRELILDLPPSSEQVAIDNSPSSLQHHLYQSGSFSDRLYCFWAGQLYLAQEDTLIWRRVLPVGQMLSDIDYPSYWTEAAFKWDGNIVAVVRGGYLFSDDPQAMRVIRIPYDESECSLSANFACLADLDNDGVVTVSDVLLCISGFQCPDCTPDIDGDGVININDLMILLQVFGDMCD